MSPHLVSQSSKRRSSFGPAVRLSILVSLAVVATSCSNAAPSEVPPASPATPSVTGIAAPLPPAQEVTILGVQGLALRGTWRAAAAPSSPALLLLHMYGGGREDWAPEAETMQQAGFSSLALDLRGQGDTGGEENWTLAIEDVAAAQAWIASQPDVDSRRRGTIGASIGANLALTHAALDPEIRAVALLSPGLNYFGVSLEGLMSSYGARPILLAASDKDAYSADTAQVLAGEASGQVDLLIYPGSAHGTELLYRTHGDFLPELMRFLQESLAP